MAGISLIQFANALGSNRIAKMGQIVELPLPFRATNLIRVAGFPSEPALMDPEPGQTGVYAPLPPFTWSDQDAGEWLKKATEWDVSVSLLGGAEVWHDAVTAPSIDTVTTPISIVSLKKLDYGAKYIWGVVPSNKFGRGPSSFVATFTTRDAPASSGAYTGPSTSLPKASAIHFLDRSPNGYNVYFWIQDLTANQQNQDQDWTDCGQVEFNNPEPLVVPLTNGHAYNWAVTVIVPDDEDCIDGPDHPNPDLANCLGQYGTVVGASNEPAQTWSFG
jgi:hypothetical protein